MRRKKRFFVSGMFLAALLLPCLTGPAKPAYAEDECGTAYEVFVYSFYDSDGDGIGDLKGLLEKLDYINDGDSQTADDLACGMLWTMPVFPSPTYHKYDVTDYKEIDPSYGTMEDFDALADACHGRGMKWILDLPVNHTSSEHPWFQAAREYLNGLPENEAPSAEVCPYVDYYHFSKEPSPGWEPLEGTSWYYEAQFWGGMPDLNLDSKAVRGEIADILAFWLDRGADGFRLDAVTSYYTQETEKSICFTEWLCSQAKAVKPDCYIVGEAWTDPDTYIRFYEAGIDSMFDFAFSGAEGVIAKVAGRKKAASLYAQKMAEEEALLAQYPDAVNAPFYTNHDMARSAGYYGRDDGSRVKLALGLNLLMPGKVFLYYGEELGMKGSGRDENKRAPMYWSSDPDTAGMCEGPPQMDEVKMKFPSWEEQDQDPNSILSYVRKAVRIREEYPVIAKGRTFPVEALSGKEICAFFRRAENEEPVLVVINTGKEPVEIHTDEMPETAGFTLLSVSLAAGEEDAVMEDGRLTLPAFGIAVLS